MRARDLEGFGPVGTNGPQPVDVLAVMNAEIRAHRDNLPAFQAEMDEMIAARDAFLALRDAGNALDTAMAMQEKRESGEFHISAATALLIWTAARKEWEAALARCGGTP